MILVVVIFAMVLAIISVDAAHVPQEFDCGMRELGLEFAEAIQPYRGADDYKSIAAALNLPGGYPGGETQCFNLTYRGSARKKFKPRFFITTDAVFYVSVTGNDSRSGETILFPFATIERGIMACRSLAASCTVSIRGGIYYLKKTVTLNDGDSNLIIQNYNGEEVIISGGRRLKTRWYSQEQFKHGSHYVTSLSGQGIIDIEGLRVNRERAFRARYPNGCKGSMTSSGYKCMGKTGNPLDGFGSSLLTDWIAPPTPTMDTPDIMYNPAIPLRNDGATFRTYQLGVGGGQCEHFSPPAGYWCGNKCSGGAPPPPGCIYRVPLGLHYNKTILPNSPYVSLKRAVVQAWHPGHWASWMFQVGSFNETHLLFSKGGFQGSRGAYVDKMADTFFIENVLEELDYEGEFYYDPELEELHFFTSHRDSIHSAIFEATNVKTLFNITGTQDHPVKRIKLQGLILQDTSITYLDAHSTASGGDWSLGRNAAIFLRGTEEISVHSCELRQLDGNAILLNAYNRDATIENNYIHEIGDNMIGLLGETKGAPSAAWGMGPDGTDGNQPRRTRIVGNLAHTCGLFEKQSSFFFTAKSTGSLIENNIFYNGPRAGINQNDGFGGDNLYRGNLLFNTVMESGDHGPFNSWDRQVFVTKVRNGTPSPFKAYDELTRNFFIGNYYGQETVDNDDGSAYFNVHHNFFAYAAVAEKSDFGGHDNHQSYNVHAFVNKGMQVASQTVNHNDYFFNNKLIQTSNTAYASYNCDCESKFASPLELPSNLNKLPTSAIKSNSCPIFFNNEIYTPDGTMLPICNMTLHQRQFKSIDKGTSIEPWSGTLSKKVLSWAREVLDLPDSIAST